MAALQCLLSSSINNRINQVSQYLHPNCSHKCFRGLTLSIVKPKFCFKIYVIPYKKLIPRQYATKTFASLAGANVEHLDFQSSKTLLDRSSNKTLDGMSDFERQLQELFDEVKSLVKVGNKADAINLLQANYEIVSEEIAGGSKGVEEAAILDIIALGYMVIGDFETVGFMLNMMHDLVDSVKDNEPLLDSLLMHMGSMYSTLGKFDKSLLAYHRAINILENIYGKNSTFIVMPLLGMAKAYDSIGRTTKSVDMYHNAIAILELNRGAVSEDLVIPLSALGNLLLKQGKALDAESPFDRILQIYRNVYGESDGRVGMAMCSLAHVKCAKGNADEAIDLYKKALQVIKNSNSTSLDDSVMENMRIDLAELLHVVGRGKEGRKLLEECLSITEKNKGKEHPNSVTHLLNLAASYSYSKNFVEAERLLRTSLMIMMKTVGHDDQSITFPMLQLAVTLYHLKRDEEAEKLALDVLGIREKSFGTDSLPVGEALDCLVSIQMRLGRDEGKLVDVLKRVLRIQEIEFGHESEEVMLTLKKLVYYLDKSGKKDEKYPLQRRLSNLRLKYKSKIEY